MPKIPGIRHLGAVRDAGLTPEQFRAML